MISGIIWRIRDVIAPFRTCRGCGERIGSGPYCWHGAGYPVLDGYYHDQCGVILPENETYEEFVERMDSDDQCEDGYCFR